MAAVRKTGRSKRRGFTMIEVLIVSLLTILILEIAVPSFIKARRRSWDSVRLKNCQRIDQAKQMFIMEYGLNPSITPDKPDLVPEFLKSFPTDPAGSYTINDGNTPCVYVGNP